MSPSPDGPPEGEETVLDRPTIDLARQGEETALDRPVVDLSRRNATIAEPDTELDRPTIDPANLPTAAPRVESARRQAPDATPARPVSSRATQARASQARVARASSEPKADTLLYVGLGVVALLILLLCVGIAIGLAGGFS